MTPISQIFLSRYYQQTRMFHMIPYKTQFACSMFTIDVRSKMSCQQDHFTKRKEELQLAGIKQREQISVKFTRPVIPFTSHNFYLLSTLVYNSSTFKQKRKECLSKVMKCLLKLCINLTKTKI